MGASCFLKIHVYPALYQRRNCKHYKYMNVCYVLFILIYMQSLRQLYPYFLLSRKSFSTSSCLVLSIIPKNLSVHPESSLFLSKGQYNSNSLRSSVRYMSASTSALAIGKQMVPENEVQQVELLNVVEDLHGGIIINMEKPMDSEAFASLLRASISQWKQQGKRGIWIKLPIELVNLVEPSVKEGFRYHHAEPDYLMLVNWISNSINTLPENASHRVGIGAFVMNDKKEVLVVKEKNGQFKGNGVWKFPTGVVNVGEHISMAAIREVKEETGIDTEFVEILAFRQSHKSFFTKSDLFFVCMLRPLSFDIQKQDTEIEAAQWMSFNDYAAQPFIQKHDAFSTVANVCLTKLEKDYAGFSPIPTTTASGKISYSYFNCRDLNKL